MRGCGRASGLVCLLVLLAACGQAVESSMAEAQPDTTCAPQRLHAIEEAIGTGDGQGHGPDVGSDEWYSVVEFRLGVRGQPDVPARGSRAWCDFVNAQAAAGQPSLSR